MKPRVVQVADDLWAMRRSSEIDGIVEVETHTSLVRLHSRNCLFLDDCTLGAAGERKVRVLEGGGADIGQS